MLRGFVINNANIYFMRFIILQAVLLMNVSYLPIESVAWLMHANELQSIVTLERNIV